MQKMLLQTYKLTDRFFPSVLLYKGTQALHEVFFRIRVQMATSSGGLGVFHYRIAYEVIWHIF